MTKKVNIDIVARDKTKRAIDSSKKSLGGLKTFALAAGAALATLGAGRAIGGLVRTGKEIESLQIRFKILFGSVDEGSKAFDNLSKFAAKVPFSLGDIAAASGNLAVVAKDADELTKILEITGNVAGATGLDFQTTASQIQRAFSGGIASADVFREKGVRDMLGFSAGAKVSVEETIAAFKKAFAGNGEFAGTTKALAGTLEGALSMVGDKFLKFQLAINESFFAELKKQFGDLNKVLDDNQANWEELGRGIGEALATALATTIETIGVFTSAIGAADRAMSDAEEKGGMLGLAFDAINLKLKLTQEVVKAGIDSFLGLNETFDAILPNQEAFHANMLEISGAIVEQTENTEALARARARANLANTETVQHDDRRMTQINKVMQKDREASQNKKKLGEDTFNQAKKMASAGAAQSKKMFRLQQGLAIGETIMNTFTAASAALKQPPGPPFTLPLVALTVATGMAQVAGIRSQQPPAQFGGSRLPNSPFLVGEKGPELFTPNTAGSVTPNHQLGSGSTNVSFNITTVDADGFEDMLQDQRGTIISMINSALNEQGRPAII